MLTPIPEAHVAFRFGAALAATGIALGLTVAFPQVGTRPYYFFLTAVVVATWSGGALPGLLSVALGAILGWYYVLHPTPGAGFDMARYGGYLLVSLLVFGLTALLHRTVLALRSSHLRFGGVVQISEDAIITVDERHRVTLFNPGAEKIFGYRPEEVLGKPLNVLLPERYHGVHEEHVNEFGKSPDVLRPMNERGTIFGRRADGSEFPAEASISKFEAAGEKIMTIRLRDISERRETEQRLRQLAAIVESSEDAIVSEDLNGVILSWNAGAEKMYGYRAAETIGRDARMLLPPGTEDEVARNIAKAREGHSSTAEAVRMRKDGRQIDVAVTVSPIRDQTGALTGLAAIMRDITDRKRLENQLLHSQKMEAVGRLAGGVAHDFNNLLSIIVGYGYMIQSSTAEGESLRNAADEIMSASEKASALTRQLLAFSRKQVMRPEVLDLNEVTAGIAKILPRLVGEDVDVRVVSGTDLRHIKADPGQVEQVIMNLVINARDAMSEGGKLTIETGNVYFEENEARQHGVHAGDYVMLAVSDTGHGMNAETRARIFEPFFTTKEPGKGTGLGLATVYGIVSQSNGHIWVYSEPGQGTTFKIYFPATADAAPQPRRTARPEPTLCGSETVLLVEDEDRLRELLSRVLADRGYKVLTAANGPEALEVAASLDHSLDLLLTDVVLPEMRGQVLAEKLADMHPRMTVIYMSGYTDNALIHSGTLSRGITFLQKPFTPDIVLRRIRDVLDETAEERRTRRKKAV